MKSKMKIQVSGIVLSIVMAMVLLTSCVGQAPSATDEQVGNREYMAEVSVVVHDLELSLSEFSGAASNKDIVAMKEILKQASKAIESLEKIEYPEGLGEVHDSYTQGAQALESALSDYVDLYENTLSLPEGSQPSIEDIEKSKQDIEKKYNEGVELLEKADELAISME